MVMLEAPTEAELDAARVSVLAPAELAGPKEAVTPGGRPEAARETVPVNPFFSFTAMEPVLEPPCMRLSVVGVAKMLKAGDALTVNAIFAVPVRPSEVPAIVMVDVPAAAELLASSVRVLPVMVLAGLNVAVTPAGNPATARFTALVKPGCEATVMVLVPLVPGAMERAEAEDDKLKAGVFVVAVKLLISGWPAGLPHPVARS
jgi:hypothetical protein